MRFLDLAIATAALWVLGLGVSGHQRRSPEAIAASIGSRIPQGDASKSAVYARTSPVTAFIDLSCPHSRELLVDLQNTVGVRADGVELRYFPLNDDTARELALLGICIRRLSFNESIEGLASLGNLPKKDLVWAAVDSAFGEDRSRELRECTESSDAQSQLAADLRFAYQLGVARSPSVIVKGYLIQGRPQASVLRSLLVSDEP